MGTPLHALIIEDSEEDAAAIVHQLERGGYSVSAERADRRESVLAALDRHLPDAVIADYGTQTTHGFDTLPLLRERRLDVPFVVVLESLDEAVAVNALRAGAHDYVMKNHAARLVHAIERGLTESAERRIRRQMEETLLTTERRYRDLVENANDIVFTADLAGQLTSLNAAGERISGFRRDALIGADIARILTPESAVRAREAIERKLVDNAPSWTELEIVSLTGGHIPVEVSTHLIIEEGRPVGVQGIARDITERKRAEAELRARERKQAAVADLGQQALARPDLQALFDDAVSCVAATLDAPHVMVVELLPGGDALLARAGFGWSSAPLGRATVPSGTGSQAGYALLAGEAVVMADVDAESRFSIPPVLREHGISSGMSVIIHGEEHPFGILSAFTRERRSFNQDDVHFLQAVANVLGTAIERRRMEEERTRHSRELASRTLAAQEEERRRISRELHDETAQSLSTLLINLDLLEPHIPPDNQPLRDGLTRIGVLARRTLDETRALSHDLRPTILDDVGLVAALRWNANEYTARYGGRVEIEVQPTNLGHLNPTIEVALFRIAQEALANSGKYADARQVRITVNADGPVVRLSVADDGRGFDPTRVPNPTREGRLGLYGMRERAALLGGTLVIASVPGEGTNITAEIPLAGNG